MCGIASETGFNRKALYVVFKTKIQLTVHKKMASCTFNHNSLRVVNIVCYKKRKRGL